MGCVIVIISIIILFFLYKYINGKRKHRTKKFFVNTLIVVRQKKPLKERKENVDTTRKNSLTRTTSKTKLNTRRKKRT